MPSTFRLLLLRPSPLLHCTKKFYSKPLFRSITTTTLPPPPKSYPYDITIGNTTVTIRNPPKAPHLVPGLLASRSRSRRGWNQISSSDLSHLEWMLRKDTLHQDMFLIGPPGGYKRRLVALYAYLCGREVDILQISRDSTEADIKQIREIRGRSVVYLDQPSVRSALSGHMLVLDGIEKAERNVLPLLNNLLENREMHLEDGRHLIPYTRYDKLVEEHGLDSVRRWKLERVHPDFRVVALGLPVPTFKGNPLDPPLRSRFQARNVGGGWSRDEVLQLLIEEGDSASVSDGVKRLADLAYGINYMNSRDFKEKLKEGERDLGKGSVAEDVPWFVVDSLFDGVEVFKNISNSSLPTFTRPASLLPQIFQLMYPYKTDKVQGLVKEQLGDPSANLKLKSIPKENLLGLSPPPLPSQLKTLSVLHEFLKQPQAQRAALLYGPQGCGKSTVAEHAAGLLGRPVTTVQVYKDMSTRDLFQVRGTDASGDTVWRYSPLVEAALEGSVIVLDGVENLHESVLGVIGGFVREGEVLLPDGMSVLGGNKLEVHPDFRLMGVGDSTDLKLTPEIASVFMFFDVEMAEDEELQVCGQGREVEKVLRVLRELRRKRDGGDSKCGALARALSVTQVKRIGERRRRKPEGDLFADVWNAACGQFLPMMERDVLRRILKESGIVKQQQQQQAKRSITMSEDKFTIGSVSGPIHKEQEEFQAKIPTTLFFDIDQHVRVLEGLADDFLHGDHLLVVGNQGVGKNKIVDRLLGVMGRGREYIQLHRDTTVQSLTTNQKIEDGVIKMEDSPLVSAARNGLVLVIDEADKAPAHVTAVLKTLAERGQMVLGDGRRILRSKEGEVGINNDKLIELHPDFRMIVLANRPGFPFLGTQLLWEYGALVQR